jgi:hypothetical protein
MYSLNMLMVILLNNFYGASSDIEDNLSDHQDTSGSGFHIDEHDKSMISGPTPKIKCSNLDLKEGNFPSPLYSKTI